jgi:uncharacterized cupin superfamily protein
VKAQPTARPVPFDVSLDDAPPDLAAYRPAPGRIMAGDPVQRAWNLYSSADGRFHAGLWECEPGRWRVVFTENEFCELLEGTLVVTDEDDTSRRYGAGDAFVTPAGYTGTWEVLSRARKRYVIYE